MKKDALVETMERIELQSPLLNDEGKFSVAKLAERIVAKHHLARYKGMMWKKEGYTLVPLAADEIGQMGLTELYAFHMQDNWGAQTLKNLETFLPTLCMDKIREPPASWLFTKNAVIDLATLEEIHPDEAYAVVNPIPVTYDPKATCPVIMGGFKKAFTEEQQLAFLSIFGARLTGSTKLKTHVILSGTGNQSKGTWREVISHIFGKRMTQDGIEFTKDKFRSKNFIGTCIIWGSETDGKKNTERLIKEITGGTTLNLETKGKDSFAEVDYQAIFVEDTNNPPSPSMSAAMKTRLQWFPMTGHFVRENEYAEHKGEPNYYLMDSVFNEEYLSDKELSGFLNLLMPYAQYFLKHHDYKHQACNDLEKLASVSESIETFLGNFVTIQRGHHINDLNTFKWYVEFCAKTGTEAKPSWMFYKALKEMGARKGAKAHQLEDVEFDKKAFRFFIGFGFMPPEGIEVK